ncbi:hypothetical protein FocTR4_00005005 [Fusarium oxysporum f. sp. cubense]|uniref:Uncharacterized protein n=1 Tax=Fusarium oxysporum f. sp. cubense TaxID=61366 RepID=A0A5C6TK13_FUSOC|nr:hypothetical protein FocTR4_00005005 [Fusarium oxysporum f. sp. cubense]
MVLLLVAKPVGGYPALHYAHGTPTVQESQVSHYCAPLRHINLGRQREVLMRRERQTARSRRLRLKARTNVGARPPDSSGMYHLTPEVITLVAWIGISGKAARSSPARLLKLASLPRKIWASTVIAVLRFHGLIEAWRFQAGWQLGWVLLWGRMYRERKGFEGCPCLVLANHTLWAGSRIDCPAQAFYLPRNIRKATSFLRGTLSHKTLVLIIDLLIKPLLTVRGLPESRKRSHHHVRVF